MEPKLSPESSAPARRYGAWLSAGPVARTRRIQFAFYAAYSIFGEHTLTPTLWIWSLLFFLAIITAICFYLGRTLNALFGPLRKSVLHQTSPPVAAMFKTFATVWTTGEQNADIPRAKKRAYMYWPVRGNTAAVVLYYTVPSYRRTQSCHGNPAISENSQVLAVANAFIPRTIAVRAYEYNFFVKGAPWRRRPAKQ